MQRRSFFGLLAAALFPLPATAEPQSSLVEADNLTWGRGGAGPYRGRWIKPAGCKPVTVEAIGCGGVSVTVHEFY